MSNNLDVQATTSAENQLMVEIRQILIRLPTGTYIAVYLPLEGPISYSYKDGDTTVKGVFTGNYTPKTLKNLINQIKRRKYSFVRVIPNGLYSYRIFIPEEERDLPE